MTEIMEENEVKSNTAKLDKTSDKSPVVVWKGKNSLWLWLVIGFFITLCLISAVGTALASRWAQDPFLSIWFIAAGLWVIGFVTALIVSGVGYKQAALGIVVGLLISLVALVASCVANIVNFDYSTMPF